MEKQYAIMHTEKGSGTGGGSGNHIDRVEGMEHCYPHADPERTKYNREYAPDSYTKISMSDAIKLRVKEGYNGKRKIRKDAVKFLETVYSGSSKQMWNLFDERRLNDWVRAVAEFTKREFGEKNVVRFTLHLDEQTPHIHCVHVPLTEDGRLSAKEIIGNKTNMSERQDRYAEAMKSFGLLRGEKNTGVKHDTAKDYYRRIKITEEEMPKLISKGSLGINKGKTLENHKTALKTALMDIQKLKSQKEKVSKWKKKNKEVISKLKNQVEILQRDCFEAEMREVELKKDLSNAKEEAQVWKNQYKDALVNPNLELHKNNRLKVFDEIQEKRAIERFERRQNDNDQGNGIGM